MTKKQVLSGCLTVLAGIALCTLSLSGLPAPKLKVRIIQTNSAGDAVDVIDPLTNKVVGEIQGIEVNHGVAVAPDGTRIYISDEAQSTLDVVDAKTLKVTKRIPLSGHPNNIAVSPDGRRVYVGIIQAPGGVDGIDTEIGVDAKTLKVTKRIPLSGHPNNIAVSPDGRRVYVGIIQAPGGVDVIDTGSLQDLKTLPTKGSIQHAYVTPAGRDVV